MITCVVDYKIDAEFGLAAQPTVSEAPTGYHGVRREKDDLGIMGHDRVQVAIVPSRTSSDGFLPSFIQGDHEGRSMGI